MQQFSTAFSTFCMQMDPGRSAENFNFWLFCIDLITSHDKIKMIHPEAASCKDSFILANYHDRIQIYFQL